MRQYIDALMKTLGLKNDIFGGTLVQIVSFQKLQIEPADQSLFSTMMSKCLATIVTVLERQYSRYFQLNVTEQLATEIRSARCDNIDAQAVMDMFSAAKKLLSQLNPLCQTLRS
ncbi:Transportin-1 [Mactra antiquata]